MLLLKRRPKLSVVVVFYDMRREAKRTLLSLTTAYQRGINISDYEVIAIDSGSDAPLDGRAVEQMQPNFRYRYVKPGAPTPCRALNIGIQEARANHVACAIDGARILSPGILSKTLTATTFFRDSFVYTLGMHLGPKRQNLSIQEGYCEAVEDGLLEQIPWESNGYTLFDISSLAGSSRHGFCGPMAESNFFTASRTQLLKMGGFDERFQTPGGGFVNLDIFNRFMDTPEVQPVMLLGEATFHQVHGGVSTNAPPEARPLQAFREEYENIRGRPYTTSKRAPIFFGEVTPKIRHLLYAGDPD